MWSRFVMSQVKHNSYFLCGVGLGLWLSLALIPLEEEGCAAGPGAAPAAPDEFEPAREQRPLGPAGQSAGRSVQRPRYYSTELGMRGSLLSGVLSSEDALKDQVAALNQTMARLQPALKFFITASAMSAVPGLANVVGFTDTREMLKPFHALKYLADNYLEEYDFFFLVSDGAFVNAPRLAELVAKLSVSQDLYLGTRAAADSPYCSLESGFIISNSVLRAVHSELDWCVRNSYSAHHHENIGRCVLHAAHLSCASQHQGESYRSVRLAEGAEGADSALADAVTAAPARARRMLCLHAYVARVRLQRARAAVRRLRAELGQLRARMPAGARNGTWPAGLRADPGLAPPEPASRFDHQRWTPFNASHAFMPDEHRAAAPLSAPMAAAVQAVVDEARAWALRRWRWARSAALAEGAWQWDAPRALRFRLLLRLAGGPAGEGGALRLVAAERPLGAARLVPVRYVTESARVALLAPVPAWRAGAARDAAALLQRFARLHAQRDANAHLHLVLFSAGDEAASPSTAELRRAVAALPAALRGRVSLAEAPPAPAPPACEGDVRLYERLGRRAVRAAGARGGEGEPLAEDALVLLVVPDLEFNQDFLNRVRMNTIRGESWFAPLPFRRHALHALAARRARTNTGRFNARAADVVAFHRADLHAAEAQWAGAEDAGAARVLAAGALRAVRAPEPGAVLPPRGAPPPHCAPPAPLLELGGRGALAQLLLETQHEAEAAAAAA